jgi:purine-binding chemotaxis protein CheW
VTNGNHLPDLDFILARDVISFLSENNQATIITDFSEKLKNRGVIILGRNEELNGVIWQSIADDPVSAYLHTT